MSFFNQFAVCKPCTGSDPTQDTVKVDPALLAVGKENVEPFSTEPQSKSPMQQQKAERLQEEEEVRKAQEARRLAEAKQAEERRRAEEEAMRRRQEEEAKKAAEEKRRLAQEQAAREAAAAAEAARQAEAAEAARLAEEALRQEEEELRKAQEKASTWCKANDFADVNTPKKKSLGGFKFPLHTAVKHHNLEMVKALIKCGADKKAQDSKGQTAYSFAMKNNKNDSMAEFLPILAPAADLTN